MNLVLQRKLAHVIMTRSLPETIQSRYSVKAYEVLKKDFSKYNAVAIGPGLGADPSTRRFVGLMVENYPGPMVIDADALNILSKDPNPLLKAKGVRILTPHHAEMARLMKVSVQQIEEKREILAKQMVKTYHCILVLKGHRSLTVSPQGQIKVNPSGNVGLATAGSGDVLTGIIAALLAQGIEPFHAAAYGVYVHGLAADRWIKKSLKASMIASDIIEMIPQVL
jgi:NAD(P)H-hydrate epimerase